MTNPETQPVPATGRYVQVLNPEDPTLPPIYDGDYQRAHTQLPDGHYNAVGIDADGQPHAFAVTVADGHSTRRSAAPSGTSPAAEPTGDRRVQDPPGIRMTIRGRLTAEPQLAYSDSGQPYLRLNVASNERVFRDGSWENGPVQYTQAVLFGQRAEKVFNQLPALGKGDEIVLRGRPELEQFTRRDGSPGAAFKVIANTVDRVPDRPNPRPTADAGPEAARSPHAQLEHSHSGTSMTGVERGDRQLQKALKDVGFNWSAKTTSWQLPAHMPSQERWARVKAFGGALQLAGRNLPPLAPSTNGTSTSLAEKSPARSMAAAPSL